jgi:tripartite-type tricarboxylate transporter receptor subunit TctC
MKIMEWKRRFWSVAAAMVFVAGVSAVEAQNYPDKAIRFIVPVGPGAGLDARAREVAAKLTDLLGQQVIIDNKPGAAGIIGMDIAAKARADGYTLAFSPIAAVAYYPSLYRKLPYAASDFVPVSLLATGPSAIYASASFPANSVKELIALAKAKPGELTFASQGDGTFQHLAGEWFKLAADVDMHHVPYKEYGQILSDVESGRVSLLFDSTGAVLPQVQAGKLKALAVTGARRLASLTNVPTFTEAGLPDFEPAVSYGVFAPAGTPQSVVDALAAACAKVQKSSDIQNIIARFGFTSLGTTPAEFSSYLARERERWIRVVKAANVQLD